MLVSSIQQHELAIRMHISPPSLSLPLPLPSRLSRSSWHTELTRLLFCWFSRLKKVIVAVLRQVVKMSFPKYKASRLASLPTTLDPAEYDISSETRKAQAKRLAIRSRLKREYQLQHYWEGNRQEGQGSPNRGNSLQVSDIFISLKQQEETN